MFLLALGCLFVLATGCVNPYVKNFQSADLHKQPSENQPLLPYSGQPQLVTSQDLKADALKMRENGYILLGRSKFQASPINEKLALKQADKVGAEVVLVNHKFVATKTESLPMSTWIPGQQTDQTERVIIQNGANTPKVIDRTVTTSTQGEYQTAYVEQSVDYYDYAASYWAKARAPIFGVNIRALDEATKAELGTQKGVVVRVVITDSPAYEADLLQGDVLLSLQDEPIRDPQQFFSLVDKYAGQTVSVLIYRSGQNLTKDVTILKK
jgi:C-terminal processing protease CtpA/Prc